MGSNKPMETVPHVDLDRFMGDWYVVANIPTFIEKNAVNAVESYSLRKDGDIDIIFTFHDKKHDGKKKKYQALGIIHNKDSNAEWRVQFFWPIKFPYKVIDLHPEYLYTVIGVPNRKYLWIMSRTPKMDDNTYEEIVKRLAMNYGYDMHKINKITHKWEAKN